MKNQENDSALVAVANDLHINSRTGLCLPNVDMRFGGEFRATPAQREICRAWWASWELIATRKAETGLPLYVVLNGDIADINRHDGVDIITKDKSRVVEHAAELLAPVADLADYFFVVEGTEAHVGEGHYLEKLIADDLDAIRDEKRNEPTWDYLKLYAGGLQFHFQHHPKTWGRMPWTVGPAAARNAAIFRLEYLESGERPPDVVCLAHVHTRGQGWAKSTYCTSVPPWQMTTTYGNRLGYTAIRQVGLLLFECRGRFEQPEEIFWTTKQERKDVWKAS